MAQETIYLNGIKELTVPQGEKISISNYGGGTAIISYETAPGNTPTKWYEQQRLTNSSVVLGTFAADQNVRIDANDSTVLYEVAVTPTGQVINAPAGTEIVFNKDELDVDIRMASAVNANSFLLEGTSGNVGIGRLQSDWFAGLTHVLQLGNASISGTDSFTSYQQNAYLDSAGNAIYIDDGEASLYQQSNGTHRFSTSVSGTAGSVAASSEKMRIDNSGNVGIGTSIPTNAKLHLSSTDGGILKFQNQFGSNTDYGEIGTVGSAGPSASIYLGINLDTPNYQIAQSNSSNSSWLMRLSSGADNIVFNRIAPGGGITQVERFRIDNTETVFSGGVNIGINTADFGGGTPGVGVMGVANATTIPGANPTNGVVLYVDPADGGYKCRGAGGTVTVIAVT